jgi:tetratricopeptide (TPR) repeat protein
MSRPIGCLKILALCCSIGSAAQALATDVGDKLGNVSFPISCKGEQVKFDRAVALLHNFYYPETLKAFQEIIKEDPECGMAYWGLAVSYRPNPLVPPFPQNLLKAGWEAVEKGKAAKEQTPKEAAYLAAIERFYKGYDTVDQRVRAQAYSNAMADLHEQYPDDSEGAIFYALSLLETIDFSDKKYGNQLKAAAILTKEQKDHPDHPGIAHYLIHSYDFAPLAAMCVSTARLYDKIAANSPHALHMPSHIYSMLGMWDDSIRSNLASEKLANEYAEKAYPGSTDAQVPHDLDFLMYAYLQQARDREAQGVIDIAGKITKMAVVRLTVDTALAAVPARFVIEREAWKDAAALKVRDSQYPAAQAITYFARGLGAARSGDLAFARVEVGHLDAIEAKLLVEKDSYWAGQTLIQKLAIEAWLDYSEKRVDEAIATMRTAADLDDASEKNVAMENKLVPIRALLGELYLAAGRNHDALPELESSLKVVPGRYATIAAAAQAARADGQTDAAKRYYRALVGLTSAESGARPELVEAKRYLAEK